MVLERARQSSLTHGLLLGSASGQGKCSFMPASKPSWYTQAGSTVVFPRCDTVVVLRLVGKPGEVVRLASSYDKAISSVRTVRKLLSWVVSVGIVEGTSHQAWQGRPIRLCQQLGP